RSAAPHRDRHRDVVAAAAAAGAGDPVVHRQPGDAAAGRRVDHALVVGHRREQPRDRPGRRHGHRNEPRGERRRDHHLDVDRDQRGRIGHLQHHRPRRPRHRIRPPHPPPLPPHAPPRPTTLRYAAMVAPVDGESFTGPTVDLRLVAAGRDGNNFQPTSPGGGLGQAASLQFFVDGVSVLTVDAAHSEYWVFRGFVNGLSLSPGDHVLFARANYTTDPGRAGNPDSRPIKITVEAAPAYGSTIEMTGDQTLPSLVGTAASRIRVNGHGHKVLATTAVDWEYVDFYDLGDRADT